MARFISSRFTSWLLLLALLTGLLIAPAAAQNQQPYPMQVAEWDGLSRFTILVMGLDRRPAERNTLQVRTDAIMVVSYSPTERRLGVLSIPRDMHFAVLDIGELVRVNTLLLRGENRQQGYGPYYSMDTLQGNLGMYIDAYMMFDFTAFISFIDFLGGITIDVPAPINDPTYPDMNFGFDPFFIRRGVQTLDGATALKYARTRHGDDDYLRGQRQLQVVEAVRQRLSDRSQLQNLIAGLPGLFMNLQGSIYTNVAPEQLMLLGLQVLELRDDQIFYGALDREYSFTYPTAEGQVRVPDRALLAQLLIEVFGPTYPG